MHEIEISPDASEIELSDFFDDDLHAFSWAFESGTTAVKKTDRPFFLYRETVIPQKIRNFFSLEDLAAGRKRRIKLWYQSHPFDAFIEKTVHPTPRTRMMWKPDFAAVLRAEYPRWPDFFRKTPKESADTPSIRFTRRQQPDQYDVEFSDAPSAHVYSAHGASAIRSRAHATPAPDTSAYDTTALPVPLEPGDGIDNDTLMAIFRCSLHGVMRPSPQTNSLVVISDHTKAIFDDTWVNNFFQYTGTGLTGKQALSSRPNKALTDTKTNGTSLYLFEVFEEGKYVFDGEAELADRPFLSRQSDSEKNLRDVYVFPLRLKGRKRPPVPKNELKKRSIPETREPARKRALSTDEPGLPIPDANMDGGRPGFVSPADEARIVSEHAHRRANGICQLCNQPAPFFTADGKPWLETHHIEKIAPGGKHGIENTVALCPNCHRKMHVLNLPGDVVALKNNASKRT